MDTYRHNQRIYQDREKERREHKAEGGVEGEAEAEAARAEAAGEGVAGLALEGAGALGGDGRVGRWAVGRAGGRAHWWVFGQAGGWVGVPWRGGC